MSLSSKQALMYSLCSTNALCTELGCQRGGSRHCLAVRSCCIKLNFKNLYICLKNVGFGGTFDQSSTSNNKHITCTVYVSLTLIHTQSRVWEIYWTVSHMDMNWSKIRKEYLRARRGIITTRFGVKCCDHGIEYFDISKIFEQLHCPDLTEGLNLSDVSDISGFSQKKKACASQDPMASKLMCSFSGMKNLD